MGISKTPALGYCMVFFLAIILIVAPLQRGMFFREDYLPFISKVSWLFAGLAVVLLLDGESVLRGLPGLLLVSVSGLYALSVLWAKGKGTAIDGAIKYGAYLGVFLLAEYACRKEAAARYFRWALVLSGVVAAMVGILSAAGVVDYKDAVVGNRIYGSFQYPNALAAYEMFVSFLVFHGWFEIDDEKSNIGRWVGKAFFALSGFIVVLIIILSYSRATWLIYAACLVGYSFFLPQEAKAGVFSRFAVALIPVLSITSPLSAVISEKNHPLTRRYLLFGAAASLILEIARTRWPSSAKEKKSRTDEEPRRATFFRPGVLLGLLLVAALLLGFGTETGQQIMSKIVPERVIKRFQTIKLTDRSLLARVFASRDAFLIAKDHPFGTGAGGWNLLYHRYQTTPYQFTETHNHFAQVLVEIGFPGLIAYSAFWVSLLYVAFKALRQRRGNETLIVSSAFGVLSLVVHSAADFDLSLPAIALALFATAGSLYSTSNPAEEPDRRNVGKPKRKFSVSDSRYILDALLLIVLAACLIVPTNRYYRGMAHGSAGVYAVATGDKQEGMKHLHEAMKLDPHTSSYAFDVARIFTNEYLQTGNPGDANLAVSYLDVARKKDPLDYNDRNTESLFLIALDRWDEAADVCLELTEMLPLDVTVYEFMAETTSRALILQAAQAKQAPENQEHLSKITEYVGRLMDIPRRLSCRQARVTGLYAQVWNPDRLDLTRPLSLALGQAYFLQGDLEAAVEHLSFAGGESKLQNEASNWLRAMAIATGKAVTLPSGGETDEQIALSIAPLYGMLDLRPGGPGK